VKRPRGVTEYEHRAGRQGGSVTTRLRNESERRARSYGESVTARGNPSMFWGHPREPVVACVAPLEARGAHEVP